MLGKVFKAYDVREKYPDPLSEKLAWKIGQGTCTYLLGEAEAAGETDPMMRNIVVARDMRPHSPSLLKALVEGITDAGGNVIDIGLVDTPMTYFAVNHLDCAGAVMTTASHNPIEYNGFKISKRKARPVGQPTGLQDVLKFSAIAKPDKPKHGGGRVEQRDLWQAYAKHVLAFLDLKGKSLKVVIDASNGMAGTMIPNIFGTTGEHVPGLTIVPLYFENDKGTFVHQPNPLVEANLRDLRDKVLAEKADLGICFDGDADRCMVVDENARIVPCDLLTALIATWMLKKNPGSAIIYDLRSSKAVEETIRKHGGKPVRGKVGHVFMKAELLEQQGVFGGELSGHFYFRDNFNADSGAIAFATVLSVLADHDAPMSKLIEPFARYRQSGEMNFHVEDKDAVMVEVAAAFEERGEIDELDGVSIDCFAKEGWWANIRKSNTEPVLRLNLEARDEATLKARLDEITPMLGELVAH
ncbi:MAG: phosphomannomutase/phosphoglucomutase [Phycisphaerales bacterium]|nr:phosphomannomutase/phosphoglucomutase [Phycisphaerales bacterium]